MKRLNKTTTRTSLDDSACLLTGAIADEIFGALVARAAAGGVCAVAPFANGAGARVDRLSRPVATVAVRAGDRVLPAAGGRKQATLARREARVARAIAGAVVACAPPVADVFATSALHAEDAGLDLRLNSPSCHTHSRARSLEDIRPVRLGEGRRNEGI